MRSKNGQALVEVAAFFLAMSILLGGFCGFTRWFVVRQKLLFAAKEGALLYSSGRWTRQETEMRMRQVLMSGTFGLEASGVRVSVGPRAGVAAWMLELDESTASYAPPEGWHYLLGAPSRLTERFVVKHAPRYWGPLQPWAGPAVSYGS